MDHGDRTRQRENHGRDAGVPPAIRARAVGPPARDSLLPARDGAGLRHDLPAGGHALLPLRGRHPVPRSRSKPADLGTDRPGLVPSVLLGSAEGCRHLPAVHHRGWHAAEDQFQRGVLGRHPQRDPRHLPVDPAVHRPRSRGPTREVARAIGIRDRLPARVDLHRLLVFDPRGRRATVADAEWVPVDHRHRDDGGRRRMGLR